MIREFKNDFSKEKKDQFASSKKLQIFLIIISILLIISLVVIFITLNDMRLIEATGMLLLPPAIALLILVIKKRKIKKDYSKPEKIINKIHFGSVIAFISLMVVTIGTFVASMLVKTSGADFGNDKTTAYVIKEGANSQEFEKLLKKEGTAQVDKIISLGDEFSEFNDDQLHASLYRDNPTDEEQIKIDAFRAYCEKATPLINDFVRNNYCVVVKDKGSYLKYIDGCLEEDETLKTLFQNVYTVDEFMDSDISLLNICPASICTYDVSSSAINYYGEPIYVNCNYQLCHRYGNIRSIPINTDNSDSYDYALPKLEDINSDRYATKWEGLRYFFLNEINQSKYESMVNNRNSLKDYINNECSDTVDLDYKKEKAKANASKALNVIYEISKPITIADGILVIGLSMTLLVFANISISKSEYNESIKAIDHDGKYLNDEQTSQNIRQLLAKDDFENAIAQSYLLQERYVEKRKIDIENSHKFIETLSLEPKSEFDGNVWQLFGWTILGNLVAFVTLGILYPVKVAWVEGWKINHRKINGKQLHFDGNGFQLLGKYILWWLLSVVTLGIYTIFLPKKIQQWLTCHTHFVNLEEETEENRKLFIDNGITSESKFEGKILALFGWRILGNLVTIFTFGILYTVKLAWIQRWRINGQVINGLKLRFDGNGFQLLGKYILWWLLSVVTLGIYMIFVPVKIEKWISKHTHFEKVVVDETI